MSLPREISMNDGQPPERSNALSTRLAHGLFAGLLTASCVCQSSAAEPARSRPTALIHQDAYRTPAMLGDYYGGSSYGLFGESVRDRLLVLAADLDAPGSLTGASQLSIREAGPVSVLGTSLGSAADLQRFLRFGGPTPSFTPISSLNADAVVTSTASIDQIRAQLAATPLAYDVIAIAVPADYAAGVEAAFAARNAGGGEVRFDAAASGAVLQSGADNLAGGEDLDALYFYDYLVRVDTPAGGPDAGLGVTKLGEAGVVLPTDRIYCRYSHVRGAAFASGDEDLDRFMPGLERTFWGGLGSVEVRTPIGLDTPEGARLTPGGLGGAAYAGDGDARFGNMATYLKLLLASGDHLAITGGLGLTLPTAEDYDVAMADGSSLLRLHNEAVRLRPFTGLLWLPGERTFAQAFAEYDVAAGGNSLEIDAGLLNGTSGSGLRRIGQVEDADAFFFDASLGYWLYRSNASRGLTGVIPTVEVHQVAATEDGDRVSAGQFVFGDRRGQFSSTSVVAATTFEYGRRTNLTAGYATPLGGGDDRQYDGAFTAMLSRRWGP